MSSELTLYEVTAELQALADTVEMTDTPEKRAECEADIERMVALQLKKVDSFCQYLAHLESQAELCDREIERIKLRQHFLKRHVERLENYAIRVMEAQDKKKLDGDTSQLRLRQNTPAVEIFDVQKLPEKFKIIVQTVTPDKRAIKKALDGGEDVPGADLRFGRVTLVRK